MMKGRLSVGLRFVGTSRKSSKIAGREIFRAIENNDKLCFTGPMTAENFRI
jgi:hypothetical protein